MPSACLGKRALLVCGAAAGPLFGGVFVALGARTEGYDWRRHPVSSLALGPAGWVQRTNFVLAGSLYVAGAAGLSLASRSHGRGRTAVPAATAPLIASVGVGMIGSGAFNTRPVSGYPPRSPDRPAIDNRAAALHERFALPIFAGIPGAALLCGRSFARAGERGWARYSVVSGLAMAASMSCAGAAFEQHRHLVARGGLLQRVAIAIGFGWLTALFGRALAG